MLTAAIIGCGRVVQAGHVLGFAAVRDLVQVVALADPVPENLDIVGEALSVPVQARFRDYRELLDTTASDFVDLALPHFLHEEVTVACADAGRHILSEKPLTISVASGARIAAAVRDAGVVFGIQHNYVHFPHYAAMHQAVASGLIGQPFLGRYETVSSGRHWPGVPGYDPDWRIKSARSGGGALIDNGYHNMYMCEIFMGKPVRTVMARVAEVENGEVDDLALTILGHEGGGASSVQVSWSARGSSPDVIEVHGKEGTLRVGDDKTVHLHSGQGDEWTVHYVPEGRVSFTLTYENVFREFASAVMEGREPAYGLTSALHNLAIIMAAYESERVGEAVSVAALERQMDGIS